LITAQGLKSAASGQFAEAVCWLLSGYSDRVTLAGPSRKALALPNSVETCISLRVAAPPPGDLAIMASGRGCRSVGDTPGLSAAAHGQVIRVR